MSDIFYNGLWASELGVYMQSRNRQVLPRRRVRRVEIPGRSGTLDYDDKTFDDRFISVHLMAIESTRADLRERMRDVANWLYGSGENERLRFSDEPNVFYKGKVENDVNLEEFITIGECDVEFRCEPFAYDLEKFDLFYDFSASDAIDIPNAGTVEVRPEIRILGTVDAGMTLKTGGNTLTYGAALADAEIVINCEDYTCKEGATNRLSNLSGDWLILKPGNNQLEVSGANMSLEIQISFYPMYL